MAIISLHGHMEVRCDCGFWIEELVRPMKKSIEVKCPICHRFYRVSPPQLEELPRQSKEK